MFLRRSRLYIHTSRGHSIIAHLLQWYSQDLNQRKSKVKWLPLFVYNPLYDAIQELMAVKTLALYGDYRQRKQDAKR